MPPWIAHPRKRARRAPPAPLRLDVETQIMLLTALTVCKSGSKRHYKYDLLDMAAWASAAPAPAGCDRVPMVASKFWSTDRSVLELADSCVHYDHNLT